MKQSKKYLLDDKNNVKRLIRIFFFFCALLFVLDFIFHRHSTHPYEHLWGFYPMFGFIGCIALVIVAKWLRTLLMRPEDYYRDEKQTGSKEPDDDGS